MSIEFLSFWKVWLQVSCGTYFVSPYKKLEYTVSLVYIVVNDKGATTDFMKNNCFVDPLSDLQGTQYKEQ